MNIKNTLLVIVATGLMLGISSCKKGDHLDKIVTPPEFAKFGSNSVGAYFITNTTSSTFKIPLGFTTRSAAERTINFTYVSSTGAAQGVQYNAPASIVIPAGGAGDTLAINGIFAGYPTGRKDTLRVKITGVDTAFNNTYTLVMQKYCNVVLNDLVGDYTKTREYTSGGALNYGPYATAMTNPQALTTTTATVTFVNLYDDGWNDINATLNWTTPGGFTVSIAKQNTGKLDGGFPVYVRTTIGKTNTFSSCDQTFSLSIELLGGAAGNDLLTPPGAGYQIRMVR